MWDAFVPPPLYSGSPPSTFVRNHSRCAILRSFCRKIPANLLENLCSLGFRKSRNQRPFQIYAGFRADVFDAAARLIAQVVIAQ